MLESKTAVGGPEKLFELPVKISIAELRNTSGFGRLGVTTIELPNPPT